MKRLQYPQEAMINALSAVHDGMSNRQASIMYKVPRSSLIGNLKK